MSSTVNVTIYRVYSQMHQNKSVCILFFFQSQKRGSFLARSKEALAKIAEMTKPVANPSAGAKSSGKFTFSVISPEKESQQVIFTIL